MVWLQTFVKDNCEHTVPEYTSTLIPLDWALDFDIVMELIVQCKRKLLVHCSLSTQVHCSLIPLDWALDFDRVMEHCRWVWTSAGRLVLNQVGICNLAKLSVLFLCICWTETWTWYLASCTDWTEMDTDMHFCVQLYIVQMKCSLRHLNHHIHIYFSEHGNALDWIALQTFVFQCYGWYSLCLCRHHTR